MTFELPSIFRNGVFPALRFFLPKSVAPVSRTILPTWTAPRNGST
jgi:hypothetical protein